MNTVRHGQRPQQQAKQKPDVGHMLREESNTTLIVTSSNDD